jgi:hypothetical protein
MGVRVRVMATSGGRKLVALLIAESSVLRRLHLG